MKAADNSKKKLFSQNINEALAILISSTKRKKRPVSLLDVSKWLDVAVRKLGGHQEVADRIGLSTKMLRQFALVTRLQPEVQRLFDRRALDSIDAVVHLLLLANKDQIIAANAIANNKIDTKDLRAIVQLRKANSKVPLRKIMHEIINTKTRKNYVVEFIIREGDSYARLMRRFRKYIRPTEIVRLDIEGSLGRLVLTRKGKEELRRIAKNLNTPLRNVMPAILSR